MPKPNKQRSGRWEVSSCKPSLPKSVMRRSHEGLPRHAQKQKNVENTGLPVVGEMESQVR